MGMGEGTCHSDVGVVVADECNRCNSRQYTMDDSKGITMISILNIEMVYCLCDV